MLNDSAITHHHHPVGELFDHTEVMADKQARKTISFLKISQQFQHPGTHSNVKRRHRLISDHELRPPDNGTRNCHALTLAAGKLVREPVRITPVEPHFFQNGAGAVQLFFPRRCGVVTQGFRHDISYFHARIE
ncbi:hypothetical protein D3C71_1829730 [compost metagenome]